MKIIQNISGLILFFTILTSLAHSALSEIPKEANAAKIWADIRLKDINEFEEKPKPELIAGIGEMLRQLTTLNYRDCAEKYYIINRIQTSLMAIPGHAQFFGDRIHTAYEPLKGPDRANFVHSAQSEMMYSFETLKHLPSPETVRVLGEMLSETWRMPFTGDYTPPALAFPAMTILGDLGIRNAPWKPIITSPDAEGAIPAWQAWWEEIKSGNKSFSFRGQTNEYRYKPDGTWETIPISLPAAEEKPKDQISKPPQAPIKAPTPSEDKTWIWFAGCLVAFMALLGWKFRKKG